MAKTTSNAPGTQGRAPLPIPTTTSANVPMEGGRGPAFPAPNAAENANARRGQELIDRAEAGVRATRDKK